MIWPQVLVLRQGFKPGYKGCIPMLGPNDFPILVSQPRDPTLGPNIGPRFGHKVESQDWVPTRVVMVPSQDWVPTRVVMVPSQDWASKNVTVKYPLKYLLYHCYLSQLPSPNECLVLLFFLLLLFCHPYFYIKKRLAFAYALK